MKLKEVLARVTGFSVPVFGVSWNPPQPEVASARRVLTYLGGSPSPVQSIPFRGGLGMRTVGARHSAFPHGGYRWAWRRLKVCEPPSRHARGLPCVS